ncbi:MAG: hypothetical protein [Bacteriophage sp.]|nr:MAG: hypothetical protein [Bacteriophage sp.]
MYEFIAFILGALFAGAVVICCALCVANKGGGKDE